MSVPRLAVLTDERKVFVWVELKDGGTVSKLVELLVELKVVWKGNA